MLALWRKGSAKDKDNDWEGSGAWIGGEGLGCLYIRWTQACRAAPLTVADALKMS